MRAAARDTANPDTEMNARSTFCIRVEYLFLDSCVAAPSRSSYVSFSPRFGLARKMIAEMIVRKADRENAIMATRRSNLKAMISRTGEEIAAIDVKMKPAPLLQVTDMLNASQIVHLVQGCDLNIASGEYVRFK